MVGYRHGPGLHRGWSQMAAVTGVLRPFQQSFQGPHGYAAPLLNAESSPDLQPCRRGVEHAVVALLLARIITSY